MQPALAQRLGPGGAPIPLRVVGVAGRGAPGPSGGAPGLGNGAPHSSGSTVTSSKVKYSSSSSSSSASSSSSSSASVAASSGAAAGSGSIKSALARAGAEAGSLLFPVIMLIVAVFVFGALSSCSAVPVFGRINSLDSSTCCGAGLGKVSAQTTHSRASVTSTSASSASGSVYSSAGSTGSYSASPSASAGSTSTPGVAVDSLSPASLAASVSDATAATMTAVSLSMTEFFSGLSCAECSVSAWVFLVLLLIIVDALYLIHKRARALHLAFNAAVNAVGALEGAKAKGDEVNKLLETQREDLTIALQREQHARKLSPAPTPTAASAAGAMGAGALPGTPHHAQQQLLAQQVDTLTDQLAKARLAADVSASEAAGELRAAQEELARVLEASQQQADDLERTRRERDALAAASPQAQQQVFASQQQALASVAQAQAETARITRERDALARGKEAVDAEAAQLRAQAADRASELQRLQEEIIRVTEERRVLTVRLETAVTQSSDDQSQLAADLALLRQNLSKLQGDHARLQGEYAKLQAELLAERAQGTKHLQDAEALRLQVGVLSADKAEGVELASQLAAARREAEEARGERSRAFMERDDFQQQAEGARADVQATHAQLLQAEGERARLASEAARLTAAAEQLAAERDAAVRQRESLSQAHDALLQARDAVVRDNSAARGDADRFAQALRDAQHRLDAGEAALRAANDRIGILETQLEAQTSEAQSLFRRLAAQKHSSEEGAVSATHEIETLKAKVAMLANQLTERSASLASQSTAVDALRRENARLVSEARALAIETTLNQSGATTSFAAAAAASSSSASAAVPGLTRALADLDREQAARGRILATPAGGLGASARYPGGLGGTASRAAAGSRMGMGTLATPRLSWAGADAGADTGADAPIDRALVLAALDEMSRPVSAATPAPGYGRPTMGLGLAASLTAPAAVHAAGSFISSSSSSSSSSSVAYPGAGFETPFSTATRARVGGLAGTRPGGPAAAAAAAATGGGVGAAGLVRPSDFGSMSTSSFAASASASASALRPALTATPGQGGIPLSAMPMPGSPIHTLSPSPAPAGGSMAGQVSAAVLLERASALEARVRAGLGSVHMSSGSSGVYTGADGALPTTAMHVSDLDDVTQALHSAGGGSSGIAHASAAAAPASFEPSRLGSTAAVTSSSSLKYPGASAASAPAPAATPAVSRGPLQGGLAPATIGIRVGSATGGAGSTVAPAIGPGTSSLSAQTISAYASALSVPSSAAAAAGAAPASSGSRAPMTGGRAGISGTRITSVTPGSFAANAGLQLNDYILSVQGMRTATTEQFAKAKGMLRDGDIAPFVVQRGDSIHTIFIRIGSKGARSSSHLIDTREKVRQATGTEADAQPAK